MQVRALLATLDTSIAGISSRLGRERSRTAAYLQVSSGRFAERSLPPFGAGSIAARWSCVFLLCVGRSLPPFGAGSIAASCRPTYSAKISWSLPPFGAGSIAARTPPP